MKSQIKTENRSQLFEKYLKTIKYIDTRIWKNSYSLKIQYNV